MLRRSLFVLALLTSSLPAHAKTLRVPEQYPTIADAVQDMHSGDVLRVGPGRHLSFAILVQLDRVTIRGAGKTKTTLSASPGLILTQAILLSQCSNVTIENLSIEGSSDYAIGGSFVSNLVIRNCRVREADGKSPGPIDVYHCDGVHVSRTEMIGRKSQMRFGFAGEETRGEVEISRCRFVEVKDAALSIDGGDVTIDRNRFVRCEGDAIVVTSGGVVGPARVRGNLLTDVGNIAIGMYGSHFVTVEANRVRQCTSGILLQSAIDAQVRKNRVSDGSVLGISVPVAGANIAENRVERFGVVGLLVGGKAALASRNVVIDGDAEGIVISASNVRARDNRVAGPKGVGIYADIVSASFDARGNRVSNTLNDGISLQGNDCTLRENRVKNAGAHGIEITGIGNQLAANAAHGSSMSDLRCDLQTNTVAGNNHFGTVEDIP